MGISYILQDLGDFTEDGFVSQLQAQLLRKTNLELLGEIRPNAVALVSGGDECLPTVLGRCI